MTPMDQYPLRNIPDNLWREARTRTTADGISLRDIFIRALELYVAHGREALWPAKKGAVAPKRKTA
jgi:hypothetical protein